MDLTGPHSFGPGEVHKPGTASIGPAAVVFHHGVGETMRTIVVLFTRDLRIRDNPALALASRHADTVVPLYVADDSPPLPPNQRRFLVESLTDLRESLRRLGGDLLVRRGDPVEQTLKLCRLLATDGIGMAEDYGPAARRLRQRLAEAAEAERVGLRLFPGVTIVEPGAVRPTTGADHYKVFTPYLRSWSATPWRPEHEAPQAIRLPADVTGDDPASVIGPVEGGSSDVVDGGETAGLRRWDSWIDREPDYPAIHDDLAADDTTRLSGYLRFGCVSPLVVAADPRTPEALVRQLCWRDFYHQVLHGFPRLATDNYRPGARDAWVDDEPALRAWQDGETGVPLVDAGMRQLRTQGWMHNRARMVAASYLTKDLGIDWRHGAAWFDRWLVDADVANNYGNWQWTAGTGNDSRPYRRFNPARQAQRYDPRHEYRDRWLRN
ncbi:cryptochrome/photolyase family protein [Stackebrandtia nassauensis]|uniref:Deoxyribodipyrimidine photo-lyase n=1 Tax=Stackebrandtia nassauensis (strain DSM 44728 / CIP 108903 / NRRL B-16338 / NBRC 102104 / LLR-40K-21) TaxID=446470 RepID=D3Q002_STANL|nr:deoxyribodipyrimidine photo-lyase [Stackebrandtia nassauensis]ADD45531.1 Deoxyribodipyrimidine photo-lyase [Stackebrandtia nassauensis DSM 44728]